MPFKKLIILFFCSSILFYSCRKELEKPSWDTQLLAPLINASMSINNILPDSILQANADSTMKIVFQNDIYNLSMDTLFQIPDTILRNSYTLPFAFTLNPGQNLVNNNVTETTYQIQDVQLRTTTIKSGFVTYKVISKVKEVVDFVYSIPCAKKNGIPFSINVSVPAANGTVPGVYNQTFDLSGYEISLTGIQNNRVNTIYTSLSATISPNGNPVAVAPVDSLIIENKFLDIIPLYAKGYFGNNTFNIGPETSNFDLFNKITDGTIQLEDVNFNLKLENPIGLDARVIINNLSSINSRTNTTINLSNSVINSPININRASEYNGTIYPTYANYPLTVNNSNIKPMIENLPDKFGYNLQITTNPLGNVSGSNDFIYIDRLLKASLDMEIPLSLIATNLTLSDTVDFNISSNNGEQNIKSGILTLFASNGFPFDATVQMYTLNENNTITDSVLGYANTIDEAPINSNYKAIGKKLTKISIPLNESKINLLYNTKKIILKIKFNTAAQPNYIKIYSNYSIDVRVVGDFNYTIKLR